MQRLPVSKPHEATELHLKRRPNVDTLDSVLIARSWQLQLQVIQLFDGLDKLLLVVEIVYRLAFVGFHLDSSPWRAAYHLLERWQLLN